MNDLARQRRLPSALRAFLATEASGGIVLMICAGLAVLVANSPLASTYFNVLEFQLGPLHVIHWINDGMMALFFLLVGLEIKRELVDGELASWSSRRLPGIAALGGMVIPALIYVWINRERPAAISGWAIPAATDIAFALGVLSLLGKRIPASLKLFLASLAILDDLGAVLIIALFYSQALNPWALAGAALMVLALIGVALWGLTLISGVHGTLAGVILAMTIPVTRSRAHPDDVSSPLHRLEHGLGPWVAFLVLPVFAMANAGVSLGGLDPAVFTSDVTLGAALGLAIGKPLGVLGLSGLAFALGWASRPPGATWLQFVGVAILCGIGFTMSLFIEGLAFSDPILRTEAKIGVLGGSLVAALAGFGFLALVPPAKPTRGV